VIFGDAEVTTGAGGDLQQALPLAADGNSLWVSFGPVSLESQAGKVFFRSHFGSF